MSTDHGANSKTVRNPPPHKRILQQLQTAEVQLLADLASSARAGDWVLVGELFHTLPPLHMAICRAGAKATATAEHPGSPAPDLAPATECPAVTDQLLALSGVEKAVQKAVADALAELASLAHDGNWEAVAAALPVVELLNYTRCRFQRR